MPSFCPHAHVHMPISICIWRLQVRVGWLLHSSPLFFCWNREGVSLNLDITDSEIRKILLSLCLSIVIACAPHRPRTWGSRLRTPRLHIHHFTHWATSLTPTHEVTNLKCRSSFVGHDEIKPVLGFYSYTLQWHSNKERILLIEENQEVLVCKFRNKVCPRLLPPFI